MQDEAEEFLPEDVENLSNNGRNIANKMYKNLDHWNPLTEEMEEDFD